MVSIICLGFSELDWMSHARILQGMCPVITLDRHASGLFYRSLHIANNVCAVVYVGILLSSCNDIVLFSHCSPLSVLQALSLYHRRQCVIIWTKPRGDSHRSSPLFSINIFNMLTWLPDSEVNADAC